MEQRIYDTYVHLLERELVPAMGCTEPIAVAYAAAVATRELGVLPETVDISAHHIAMLLGDDLNDISQIFSESENAVHRVALTIENIDKWGAQWIVFPNAVYGSSANYAAQYGFLELFDYFDYTAEDSDAWKLYE